MAGKRIIVLSLGLVLSFVIASAGAGCDTDDTRSPTEPPQAPQPPAPAPTTPPKAVS